MPNPKTTPDATAISQKANGNLGQVLELFTLQFIEEEDDDEEDVFMCSPIFFFFFFYSISVYTKQITMIIHNTKHKQIIQTYL